MLNFFLSTALLIFSIATPHLVDDASAQPTREEVLRDIQEYKAPFPKADLNEVIRQQFEKSKIERYAYKPPFYWVRFQQFKFVSAIFNGTFDKQVNEWPIFRRYFNSFITAYSAQCAQLIEDPVIFEALTTTSRYNGLGVLEDRTTRIEQKIFVDRQFAPFYKSYANSGFSLNLAADWLALFQSNDLQQTVSDSLDIISEVHGPLAEMGAFIQLEGCKSPATKQFRLNLLKAAQQKPSIQQSGGLRNYSVAELVKSTTLLPVSVGEACVRHYKYHYGEYDFCRCVDRHARQNLNSAQKRAAIENFSLLRSSVNSEENEVIYKCIK